MLEFSTAAELRAHYVAVRARTNAWPPPKKTWHTPHLVEARRVLFSRVVCTVVNEPIIEPRPNRKLVPVIQQMVCEHYRISLSDLFGPKRTAAIVFPRHVAIYLVKRCTLHSQLEIGRRFGGRDHSSVHHACAKIAAQRADDAELNAELKEFERRLGVA